jgi:uncharacterized protein YjbI with pentapeptide repeats
LKRDGTIVDPIQSLVGGIHSYSGINLEPNADLSTADLEYAILYKADLSNAVLSDANLSDVELVSADLSSSDLNGANLSFTDLQFADLSGANLSGANLSFTFNVGTVTGSPYYDEFTNFWNSWTDCPECGGADFLFNPVTAGWTLVPEPATLLLALLALVAAPIRVRYG